MTRAEYLATHTISRDKPWEAEGISRRTWYYRRKRCTSGSARTARGSVRTACTSHLNNKNQSNDKKLADDAEKLDYAAKKWEINFESDFPIEDEKRVIIVKSTKEGIIITTKRRYKNCKDYEKVRLKDRPNFTVTKTYDDNWRRKKRCIDIDYDYSDYEEEEIRNWNRRSK
jgi:hypothetical protein